MLLRVTAGPLESTLDISYMVEQTAAWLLQVTRLGVRHQLNTTPVAERQALVAQILSAGGKTHHILTERRHFATQMQFRSPLAGLYYPFTRHGIQGALEYRIVSRLIDIIGLKA